MVRILPTLCMVAFLGESRELDAGSCYKPGSHVATPEVNPEIVVRAGGYELPSRLSTGTEEWLFESSCRCKRV
jgi:hypothetical protein